MKKLKEKFIPSFFIVSFFILTACGGRKVAVSQLKNEEMKNEEVISNEEKVLNEENQSEQYVVSNQQLFSNSEQLNFEIAETEQGTEIIVREQGKETKIKTKARVSFSKQQTANSSQQYAESREHKAESREQIAVSQQATTSKEQKTTTQKEKATDNGRNTRWAILWGGIVLFVGMLMNWDRIFKMKK